MPTLLVCRHGYLGSRATPSLCAALRGFGPTPSFCTTSSQPGRPAPAPHVAAQSISLPDPLSISVCELVSTEPVALINKPYAALAYLCLSLEQVSPFLCVQVRGLGPNHLAVAGWTEQPSATLPSLKPNGSRLGIRGESGAVPHVSSGDERRSACRTPQRKESDGQQ